MLGTESIETIVTTSSKQQSSFDTIIIFESGGSTGNYAIFLPNWVKLPKLSKAPKIQSWYIELSIVYCGGGSMN